MNKMYHYTDCGLRNVWLSNGFAIHDTPYGKGVAIHDVEGLHRVLARALVHKPGKLSGTEIRFLRKEMELSQASLAASLGVNAQTVALWEKGRGRIQGPADKMLRVLVSGHFTNHVRVRRLIDQLNELDQLVHEDKMIFRETGKKWQIAA